MSSPVAGTSRPEVASRSAVKDVSAAAETRSSRTVQPNGRGHARARARRTDRGGSGRARGTRSPITTRRSAYRSDTVAAGSASQRILAHVRTPQAKSHPCDLQASARETAGDWVRSEDDHAGADGHQRIDLLDVGHQHPDASVRARGCRWSSRPSFRGSGSRRVQVERPRCRAGCRDRAGWTPGVRAPRVRAGFVHVGFSRLSMIVHSPGRRDVARGGGGDVIRASRGSKPVVQRRAGSMVRSTTIVLPIFASGTLRLDGPDRKHEPQWRPSSRAACSRRALMLRAERMPGSRMHERHFAVDDAHRRIAGSLDHVGGDARHQIRDPGTSAGEREIDGDVDEAPRGAGAIPASRTRRNPMPGAPDPRPSRHPRTGRASQAWSSTTRRRHARSPSV